MGGWRNIFAIAVGGSIGTLLRLGADEVTPIGAGIPWATLTVNVIGAAVIGWAVALPRTGQDEASHRFVLIGPGICGGLTTFSALCWELLDLLDRGRIADATLYLSLTITLGLVALTVTHSIARRTLDHPEELKWPSA